MSTPLPLSGGAVDATAAAAAALPDVTPPLPATEEDGGDEEEDEVGLVGGDGAGSVVDISGVVAVAAVVVTM